MSNQSIPVPIERVVQQLPDMNDVEAVELEISADGKTVYFNVNGVTVQRIVNPRLIVVNDHR